MEKEFMCGMMVRLMKETSETIQNMETDTLNGVMVNLIKEIILKTAELEKVCTDGRMNLITTVLSSEVRDMGSEFFIQQMVQFMKAIGSMTCNMVKASSPMPIKK